MKMDYNVSHFKPSNPFIEVAQLSLWMKPGKPVYIYIAEAKSLEVLHL